MADLEPPLTPELDKINTAMEDGSREIGAFLEWPWWDAEVTFYRNERIEVTCNLCHGTGRNDWLEANKPVNTDTSTLSQVDRLLAKVTPKQLGRECKTCGGKGFQYKEHEIEGPTTPQYWLNKYFKIDDEIAEHERMKLLEHIRLQNSIQERLSNPQEDPSSLAEH